MLYTMFVQTLKEHADDTAIVYNTWRLSYRELYRRILICSEKMHAWGIQTESRVLLVLPNCPEFLIAYYAIARLQAIVIPLNHALKEDEFAFYIHDCTPAVVITNKKSADLCARVLEQLEMPIHLVVIEESGVGDTSFCATDGADDAIDEYEDVAPYAGDLVYHYSSGSTGRPKRVSRTQRNLFYEVANVVALLSISSADNFLCTVPLLHTYGEVLCMLVPISAGATVILLEPYMQDGVAIEVPFAARCARVVELMREERVTFLPAVPYIFDALAEDSLQANFNISSLRACYSAGSFLSRQIFERFRACYGLPIRQIYGSTESGVIAANIESNEDVTHEVAGTILPVLEVKILNDEGVEVPVGVGGEVVISGSTLTSGYANLADSNKEAFHDGAYATGDIGKKDEKGLLYITGRKKLLIDVAGGYKVDPIEVEDVLHTHANVVEAVVVGIRKGGQHTGATLKAFVVANALCSEKELFDYCQKQLANFKVPSLWEFRAELPHSSLGKILREELVRDQEGTTSTELVGRVATSVIASLLAAPVLERQHLLERYVCNVLAQILHVSLSTLDIHRHLILMGLDSLMVVQFKQQLEMDLGVTLSLVKILQGLTIAQIAATLLEHIETEGNLSVVPLEMSAERVYEYPLSYGQRALWYMYQSAPDSAVYNIFVSVRILAGLDIDALQVACQQLVNRHSSLRTVYVLRDGKPVQRILEAMPVNFHRVDVSGYSAEAVQELLVEVAHRPFVLEREGPFRVHLFHDAQHDPILLLTVHHIATDFWSTMILLDELRNFYSVQRTGGEAELPPLPWEYSDYQRWEAQYLAGPAGQRLQEYWQQQLAGELPVLNLPTDHVRSPLKTTRGTRYLLDIDTELTGQVRQIARDECVTVYTVLLTAFQIVLARYSGQDKFLLGTPTMIRDRAELQNLVGYFVNIIVLKAEVDKNIAFSELLQRVSSTVFGALEHKDLPFMRLVESLLTDRDPSRSPILDVLFVLERSQRIEMRGMPELAIGKRGTQVDMGGLSVESYPLRQQCAQFDLALIITETDEVCMMSWEYNEDLFDAATIERLAGHFQQLLRSIVVAPEQKVSQLQLLTDAEQQVLMKDWNTTQCPYPDQLLVHQLVAGQAQAQADAIAIVEGDKHLTYGELEHRAVQLAAYLRGAGIKSETFVGICTERGIEMLIGMLGVLKAGAAYIPLDPLYPQERLNFMLNDAIVPLVLTQKHLLAELSNYTRTLVCLDTDWFLIEQQGWKSRQQGQHQVNVQLDSLAYTIYTSGSTGQPKGVQISHRSLLNLVAWHKQTYEFDAHVRTTQIASMAFDACVWEIWPPLAAGACLFFPDEETRLSPSRLRDWLLAEMISHCFIPTPIAEGLLNLPWPTSVPLRYLLTGGDTLHQVPDLVLPFHLINHYGPTECTVVSTAGEVDRDTQNAQDRVRAPSIGRPISNAQVFILDTRLQLVPIGVVGELCVGGISLSRGYLFQPELTAEKFVPHPFSSEPGARLYRTGDLARYLPDGQIEFIGRLDEQVKLRGYRIELGEIESVLKNQAQVREAVVLAREDRVGNKRLVAYIIPEQATQFSWEQVQAALQQRLPDYMVPLLYVVLEAFPLTSNGKVDRRALPAPDYVHPQREYAAIVPRTLVEQALAEIWSHVLGVEEVGIYDNFFALGGDSILSIQIVARANQRGIHITPKQLFVYKSIAALVQNVVGLGEGEGTIQAEQGIVRGEVPLTAIQRWFFAQEQLEPSYFNQSMLFITSVALEPQRLRKALLHVIMQHDALRLRFTRATTGWRQAYAPLAGELPLHVFNAASLSSSDQRILIENVTAECQASLNLETGPVLRFVYFALDDEQAGQLLCIIHHLVVDGISWRILLEDLQTAYLQLSQNNEIHLPAKTTSWQQWAQRLQTYAQEDALDQERTYWRSIVSSPTLPYPTDEDAGENTVASERIVQVFLSQAETYALLHSVPQVYHTQINDVLLTALARMLRAWVGTGTHLISLEGHGREELFPDLDLSRTVGWFTSIYPICLMLDDKSADLATELKAIKEQLRAIPTHGIGYGILRYLRQNDGLEDLAHGAQSAISFNYLGQFDQTITESALFSTSKNGISLARSLQGKREHLLDITSVVSEGRLSVSLAYSRNRHREATIAALAQTYVRMLRELIEHCQLPGVGGYTPSDFPLTRLKQWQLDAVVEHAQDIEAIYPLSPLQQGLLFQSLYAPGVGDYITQVQMAFHGEFAAETFILAWQQIVQRHAILRTGFIWEEVEEPLQIVYRQVKVPYTLWDWRHYTQQEQRDSLASYSHECRLQEFQLSQAPLMRLDMVRLSDEYYECIWTHHHLLLDGWSLPLLFKEVFSCYEAMIAGNMPQLGPVYPYQNYIAWLQKQDVQAAEIFWRNTLADFTTPTSLSLASQVPSPGSQQPDSYVELQHYVPSGVSDELSYCARTHHLTLNTLLLGAWALLCARYSGQNDVVFGATVSGRPAELSGVEQMVGLFINTLPVRVQLSAQMKLLPWLQSLQEKQSELRQYEYSQLAQIQSWSQVPAGSALFESLFVFENYPSEQNLQDAWVQNLFTTTIQVIEQTHYPLTLVALHDQRLHFKLTYDRRRFAQDDMLHLLGHLQVILEYMPTLLQEPVVTIPMLTSDEYKQIVEGWNATQTVYPQDRCIHQLLEEQVAESPDTIALVYEEQQISYAALNRRANQLGHYLRQQGVRSGVCVGLYVERSLEMIIGLCGILKAGGVYLPLDTAYPAERRAWMLEDAQVSLLLTQQDLLERGSSAPISVLCLDTDWPQIAQEREDSVDDGMRDKANLAYVMYTSGSTGQPKGVEIPHQAIVRLVRHNWFAQMGAQDVFLHLASVAFDASTLEIWGSLLNGARLVLFPSEVPSIERLGAILREQAISILWLTAGLFQQVVDQQPEIVAGVKQVLAGGDVLGVEQVRTLLRFHAEQVVINGYGPTENTTFTCCYRMESEEQVGQPVPIGRPISNTSVYVVDQNMQVVPPGVVGELYTGGDGLARGYLNRPQLTAERFVPNPFSTQMGSRLYRTGDRVRFLADGRLEFVGRLDQQVKVRGYRIELGEIEHILEQQEQVQGAVVQVRDDMGGSKKLVAYIIPAHHFSWEQVRDVLQERLPDYMVPALHVVLEAFPLTSNGKIDRRALPAPDSVHLGDEQNYTAARNATEEQLVKIWQQVLGIERVGIHDNFFALGGDSIVSIQVVARAHQAGLHLTARQIFQHKTIYELGSVVQLDSMPVAEQSLVTGSVPLTPIQHWFFELETERDHWNQDMLLTVPPMLDMRAMRRAVAALQSHHDVLRLRVVRSGNAWQQYQVGVEETIPFISVDLALVEAGKQTGVLSNLAAGIHTSLNLESGPVMRVVYFSFGTTTPGRLLIIIHHMAVDGVSWRILLEDLQTAYTQLSSGQVVQLPSKTTSFQHWSRQLNAYALRNELKQELPYWLMQQPGSVLPLDYESQSNTVASSHSIELSLTERETRALLQNVPAVYHTQINDVLLTALVVAMTQWTGGNSVCLDLEGHGREDILAMIDLSRTIGWFTSLYPVVLYRGDSSHIGDILKTVKEQLRQIPQHGIGYGLLRYLCQDEEQKATLARVAPPQISFNYLGQFDQTFMQAGPFAQAAESTGVPVSLVMQRPHLIDISGSITSNRLRITWMYSKNIHRSETITRVAQSFVQVLRDIIVHCQQQGAGGYTPSDFPLAQLTQEQIDTLIGNDHNVETVYPLSMMQQGFLFHALYDTQGDEYLTHTRWTLRGNWNIVAWMQAWQEVIKRHQILRTALLWEQVSLPQQIVYRHVTMPWIEHDWRALAVQEQDDQLKAYLQADRERGFELTKAPLMRMTLIQVGDECYKCIWSHHHILLDGWSLPLLFKEVLAYYAGIVQNKRNIQLLATRPYQDYIAWLQQQNSESAKTYWQQTLQGFKAPTPLGIDHPASAKPDYAEFDAPLNSKQLDALQHMARQHNLTLNTLVQGAWALVLSRYSGHDDVVFGTTISGRPPEIKDIEFMVGLFINTCPVRIQLNASDTVLSWLHLIQQQQAEMRQYEYSALSDIQRWSEVRPGLPLFESLVIFESYPVDEFQLEDKSLSLRLENNTAQVNYPLALIVIPGQEFTFKLLYDAQRIEQAAIERLLGHLQHVLGEIVADPIQPLGQISLLTASELQVFEQWSGQTHVDKGSANIVQRFEAQATRRSFVLAAQYEDDRALYYKELNQQANQLANYLQRQGVRAGISVGVYMPRSLQVLVTMLGILKAGGVCVPIDSHDPLAYVEHCLDQAHVRVLVTQQHMLDRLPAFDGLIVNLDQAAEHILAQSTENIFCARDADDVAYKMFSAGNCVHITHNQLNQQICRLQELAPLTEDDVLLQQGSLSLETTLWEYWWPLLSGAKVIISSEDAQENVAALLQLIELYNVTVIHLPPMLLGRLLTNSQPSLSTTVRTILCSGGPLTKNIVAMCLALENIQSFYLYTTPETCMYLYSSLMDAASVNAGSVMPATPVQSTTILDRAQQRIPIGVTGDLYVLMDTYCYGSLDEGSEQLETPSIIRNTLQQGTWLFKTGQRARYLDDGRIEVVGMAGRTLWRGDYYVSMDVLQKVMLGAPGVEDCVVHYRSWASEPPMLVAYVVPVGQFQLQRLQAYMSSYLPVALLPEAYIPVSILPLTSTGHCDELELSRYVETTPEALKRWETLISEQNDLPAQTVKAVIQEYQEETSVLHLSDLLPNWKVELGEGANEASEEKELQQVSGDEEESGLVRMAFSDGGSIAIADDQPDTLSRALMETASRYKDKGIIYIQPDGTEDFQSYADLFYEATCILHGLQLAGLRPQDKAILQIETLREHFATFWACVLGGIIPVTVAVAQAYHERNSVINKLYNIWELLDHPPIIARVQLVDALNGLRLLLPMQDLRVLSVDTLKANQPGTDLYPSQPEDVVFFQLTSGSTGVPKCIQETHRGIIHHIHGARQFNGYTSSDVSLNWLPVDHVVPILTCHLKDVYLGCNQIEVRTEAILAHPLKWLDAIEKYHVTHTWSPNFGYKLVSDWLAKGTERSWDLTSMRYFLNAGEQVTLPVTSEFLRLTAPFGVVPHMMQPSFGMAEACTCMTFQEHFDLENGVHRIEKASLGGRLRKVRTKDGHAIPFVDLGGPVPGVQIRITDSNNKLLPEGVIGRFQIKGAVITPGYYKNAKANEEAFVGDGWFNSGDLGFILDGRLTLTGREKEIIIINGANHYCYEIEDVINEIAGVEPTFVGACGVADNKTGTEGLAIFFTPAVVSIEERVKLIQAIRIEVNAKIGLNPLYIIPVEKKDFPKTTSGKIQRTQLKKSLQAGDFDEILKMIDIQLANNNTLPDWFYQKSWERRDIEYHISQGVGSDAVLLVADELGLGARLQVELERSGRQVISIEIGEQFAQLSTKQYRVEPMQSEQYLTVLQTLQHNGISIGQIIYLYTYSAEKSEPADSEHLEAQQKTINAGVLHLVQALQNTQHIQKNSHVLEFYLVSSYTQVVHEDDPIALDKLTLAGLIKTLGQELPWVRCRQIDMPVADPAFNVALLLQEIGSVQGDTIVAYRDGIRLIQHLSKVRWTHEPVQKNPLIQGGFYLLSGGLGGVGVELARHLLQHYQARLLLVGRRPLPPRNLWAKLIADEDPAALLVVRYLELTQAGGEITYVTVDICDQTALESVVREREEHYGRSLDGIFHLAATFTERVLQEETIETFTQALEAKVTGTWVLHQLLKRRANSLFVTFSSVNGFFGGAAVGAYAAANSFLDTFVHYQRKRYGLQCYCFAWSMWDEVGMSRGYHLKGMTRAHGYFILSARQALSSLLIGLQRAIPFLLIGLDGGSQFIRSSIQQPSHALQEVVTYIASQREIRYEQDMLPANYRIVIVKELFVTEAGIVDVNKLVAAHQVQHGQARGEIVEARNEVEQTLINVWRAVFNSNTIGIHDNFFSLGGDSIVSIQIVARANQANIRLTTKQLLQYPTIAGLAGVVNITPVLQLEQGIVTGNVPLTPIQAWFFQQDVLEPQHWNMSQLLTVERIIEPKLLKAAFAQVLQHHDVLRMRYIRGAEEWKQHNMNVVQEIPFTIMHLATLNESAQKHAIELMTGEFQQSLDLQAGPLIRMVYFDAGPWRKAQVAIIVHHLVIDGVSWRILLEDLQRACKQLELQQTVQLPAKTLSFKNWSEQLVAYAQSDGIVQELDYWLAQAQVTVVPLPKDYSGGYNTIAGMQAVTLSLDVEETKSLLYKVPEAYNTQMNDILLAALALTMKEWTGAPTLRVDLEGHGREDILEGIDISRTIGWFTSLYPFTLDLAGIESTDQIIKAVKEQLRKIPQKGIGYGILHYLARERNAADVNEKIARLRTLPTAEISFNYLGQFGQSLEQDALFTLVSEALKSDRSPRGARQHILNITESIIDGQLRVNWIYSEPFHSDLTIKHWAERYMQALRYLIAYCQGKAVSEFTPSDFPLTVLEQGELDMIVKKQNRKRGR